MELPIVGRREVVYQNKNQTISRVEARFTARSKEFFVNEHGARVGLVITRGNDLLLVRQYRLLIHAYALEIPGGRIDPDEPPEMAAIREGVEETGLECLNLKPLLFYHAGLDTVENPTHVFWANEFQTAPPEKIHREEINDHVWVPISQCVEMIFAGQILDALTIVAILAYEQKVHRIRPAK